MSSQRIFISFSEFDTICETVKALLPEKNDTIDYEKFKIKYDQPKHTFYVIFSDCIIVLDDSEFIREKESYIERVLVGWIYSLVVKDNFEFYYIENGISDFCRVDIRGMTHND